MSDDYAAQLGRWRRIAGMFMALVVFQFGIGVLTATELVDAGDRRNQTLDLLEECLIPPTARRVIVAAGPSDCFDRDADGRAAAINALLDPDGSGCPDVLENRKLLDPTFDLFRFCPNLLEEP